MAVTPIRNLRVPDDEWQAWKQAAGEQGITGWIRSLASAAITAAATVDHEPAITTTVKTRRHQPTPPPSAPVPCPHPKGARIVVNPDLGLSRCGACGDTLRR